MAYDAIIIGSGSAGGVLAERLTHGTSKNVLLIEAGIDASTNLTGTNANDPSDRRKSRRANATQNSIDYSFTDWGYTHADGTAVAYGKMLGGSSAHNGQQTFRGTRKELSGFPTGWRYDDLAPYYTATEAEMSVGPYPRINWDRGAFAFEKAALSLGYPAVPDFNQAPDISNGVGPTTVNIKGMSLAKQQVEKYDGRRSVLETFLEKARSRPNLTIRRAFADKVVLSKVGSRSVARGVTLIDPVTQASETIEAPLVVSAANVFGSPTLLMRSGIGPNQPISLPAVGRNYQNQPIQLARIIYDQNTHPQFGYPIPVTINKDYDKISQSYAILLLNSADPILNVADSAWGSSFKDTLQKWRRTQYLGVFPIHTTSVGRVSLDSTKPNGAAIEYSVSDGDRGLIQTAMAEAIRVVQQINNVGAGLRVESVEPVGGFAMASHGAGTCAMGSDPRNSVVDTNMRVHGIDGLIVCDGSVMPAMVQSPHLTVSAMAYKLAETFIKPQLWGLAA